MNFLDIQFPTDISYGAMGGPVFNTHIIETTSGNEQRNINWHTSLSEYNVGHLIKTRKQMEKVISFFRIMKGRAIGFRFKDWLDYKIENTPLIVKKISHYDSALDRNITYFKSNIIKRYSINNNTYIRKITKPVQDSIILTAKTSTSSRTIDIANTIQSQIDFNTGEITLYDYQFNNYEELLCSCEFDVPVRFNTDSIHASITDKDTFNIPNIKLKEIRL